MDGAVLFQTAPFSMRARSDLTISIRGFTSENLFQLTSSCRCTKLPRLAFFHTNICDIPSALLNRGCGWAPFHSVHGNLD
jgi:hypothetical protein